MTIWYIFKKEKIRLDQIGSDWIDFETNEIVLFKIAKIHKHAVCIVELGPHEQRELYR